MVIGFVKTEPVATIELLGTFAPFNILQFWANQTWCPILVFLQIYLRYKNIV
jgi:hypothetical protein